MKLDRPGRGYVALDITSLHLLSTATSSVYCVELNMESSVMLLVMLGLETSKHTDNKNQHSQPRLGHELGLPHQAPPSLPCGEGLQLLHCYLSLAELAW